MSDPHPAGPPAGPLAGPPQSWPVPPGTAPWATPTEVADDAVDITPGDRTDPDAAPATAPATAPSAPAQDLSPAEVVGDPASEPPADAPHRRGLRESVRAVPLRGQLVAILVATLLSALAVTGFGVQAILRGYLVGQIDEQLTGTYRAAMADPGILRVLTRPSDAGGPQFPTQFATRVSVEGGPDRTNVPPDLRTSPPEFEDVTNAAAEELAGRVFTVEAAGAGSDWHAVVVPTLAYDNAGNQYAASVTLALPLDRVDKAVARLRWLTLSVGGAAIMLFAILGWLAIRRAFRPLVEVEETAAVIAAGDLSRRIPARPATTEVGRLTASLNTMLSHIETAFRAREASEARTRRFAADASHELRTPLAAIRGFAELYRQGAVPTDEVPRTMRRIEDEATRMGGLVEDLLLLARLDEQRPGRSEPVDLTVLAADAVHDARGLDAERPVALVGLRPGSGPQPAVVVGDEDRLRQVVANLVANAVRHTPAGTPVEVAVGTEPAPAGQPFGVLAVLEVRDHGRGLDPEQAEKIFERFYRVDSSRWRGTGGGSGLGLSIVSAVVTAHSGQVAVRTTPGGGATFRVALPGAPADAQPPRD